MEDASIPMASQKANAEPTMSNVAGPVTLSSLTCGNGFASFPSEACDDGNQVDGDGCSADCLTREPGYRCEGAYCAPLCGDGLRVGVEQQAERCDDGNESGGDGCDSDCFTEWGFVCPLDGGACSNEVICGDGIWQATEECDPRLPEHELHCSEECTTEAGYLCLGNGCELSCEDGSDVSACSDVCSDAGSDCQPQASCGDGLVSAGERCDNRVNHDVYAFVPGQCAAGCVWPAFCGDGVVQTEWGERCDLGELNADAAYDGCTFNCRRGPHCGDGLRAEQLGSDGKPWEECDDGNHVNNDGCSVMCQRESSIQGGPK
jgi:cysteine-rich repeat protein